MINLLSYIRSIQVLVSMTQIYKAILRLIMIIIDFLDLGMKIIISKTSVGIILRQ